MLGFVQMFEKMLNETCLLSDIRLQHIKV